MRFAARFPGSPANGEFSELLKQCIRASPGSVYGLTSLRIAQTSSNSELKSKEVVTRALHRKLRDCGFRSDTAYLERNIPSYVGRQPGRRRIMAALPQGMTSAFGRFRSFAIGGGGREPDFMLPKILPRAPPSTSSATPSNDREMIPCRPLAGQPVSA